MAGITTLGGGNPVTHFTYLMDPVEMVWRIACMPSVTDFRMSPHHPNYLRSDDVRAVTCHMCKSTDIFKRMLAKK